MKLKIDLHSHTVSSGHAYSTLLENLRAAKEKGLEALAMTDHGPNMPGGPHLYHFYNLLSLPTEYEGIRLLRGVEANIMDRQGQIDLSIDIAGKLDIVLAGAHFYCISTGSVEENSKAIVNAMANPFVDIIVHPGNPEFEISPELIMEGAARHGCAVEVNNSSLSHNRRRSKPFCLKIAQLAVEYKVPIAVGSDAHFVHRIGEFGGAEDLLLEVGVPEELILNTSQARLDAYLASRRAKRPS